MADRRYWIDRKSPDTGEWIERIWRFGPLSAHAALTLTPVEAYKYIHAVHLIRGLSNRSLPGDAEFVVSLGVHDIVRIPIPLMRAGYGSSASTFQTESAGTPGAETRMDANLSVVTSIGWLPSVYVRFVIPIPLPPQERLIVRLPSGSAADPYPDDVRFYIHVFGSVDTKKEEA